MTLPALGSRRIPRLEVVDDLFASLRRCFIPGCSELVLQERHGLCDRHRARLHVLAPQITNMLAQDLADSNPDVDATPRARVPLREKLVTEYAPAYVQCQPDGGVVITFTEPGGNLLLLSFERSEAVALLSDLATALGFTLQRRRAGRSWRAGQARTKPFQSQGTVSVPARGGFARWAEVMREAGLPAKKTVTTTAF